MSLPMEKILKIENIQYKACIAITRAIQGTFRERLYQELGLESLENRRWYGKSIFFHKIVNIATPSYLTSYLFTIQEHQTKTKSESLGQELKISNSRFFPFCVDEWYKPGSSLRGAKSIKYLKSMFKEFFNLKQRSLFVIHDLVGVKLLSRLRLKFSHLNELKFRHSFKDPQSPMSYV